jgi:sterol desaturase/sphingolipid hydroxylase (fatty acid hydroxylase superfamily)
MRNRNDLRNKKLPFWVTATAVAGTFGILLALEIRCPLRRQQENKLRRGARNFAVAGTAAMALSLTEMPVAEKLTRLVERREIGLLKIVKIPVWLETVFAVLLLDYTFYLWHVLTHKTPFLWRFHLAHHVDLEMDASTAFRFHAGEMTISTVFRAAQILAIGVSPLAFSVWQTLMLPSVLFHHSNVRLPENIEKFLGLIIVTPRIHDIHHRAVRDKTDSNWASGLSFWDRLHNTWRDDFDDCAEPIGIANYQKPEELTLTKVLALPFGKERDAWVLQVRDGEQFEGKFQDIPARFSQP